MTNSKKDLRFMEFRLGDQHFGLPLLEVKEVIQRPDVTQIPNMPSHFEGMMNLRGQILGVFNVRKKLAAKTVEKQTPPTDVVIVIEKNNVSVGIIVDEVMRVLHANESMMRPAPLKDDDPAKKFIGQVIQGENGLVLTLDVDQLLELQKYQQLKAAA
jgi:purine-binding chemotaxis protein CheW